MTYFSLSFISALLLAASLTAAPPAAKQPIYIYLYASVTDHVNLDITEDRLRRLLPMVERYQKDHPQAHVSATILFSGSASRALAERNGTTHIVDFVKGYLQKGIIEAGYDGADEPTYITRPFVDFTKAGDPQQRFLIRKTITQQFLTEGRDPITGAVQAGASGGLKKMEEVFGPAASLTGLTLTMKSGPGMPTYYAPKVREPGPPAPSKEPLIPEDTVLEMGGDTEMVINLKGMNSKGIIFGVADVNPARLPGFGRGRADFSTLISPIPETAPEVYWQDNVLRTSEASGDIVRTIHAYGGLDGMKKLMEKINRNNIHVVHVELGNEQNYVKPDFAKGPGFPALRYAYAHPDSPQLPAEALLPKADVDQTFAKEEALLKYLVDDLIPSEPNSRIVSAADLTRMAGAPTGFRVSMSGFRAALADFLKTWGDDTFAPPVFRADGRYLSRAEMFQVMVDALGEFHRTGKLPDSVEVVPVFGPVRVLTGHGPNTGEISVAELARVCADLAPPLHDQMAGPVPKNSVPIGIPVQGVMLNPAQLVRLMALGVMNPSPEAKLNIRMVYENTSVGTMLPKSRPDPDAGFTWTLKPVTLDSKLQTAIAQ